MNLAGAFLVGFVRALAPPQAPPEVGIRQASNATTNLDLDKDLIKAIYAHSRTLSASEKSAAGGAPTKVPSQNNTPANSPNGGQQAQQAQNSQKTQEAQQVQSAQSVQATQQVQGVNKANQVETVQDVQNASQVQRPTRVHQLTPLTPTAGAEMQAREVQLVQAIYRDQTRFQAVTTVPPAWLDEPLPFA